MIVFFSTFSTIVVVGGMLLMACDSSILSSSCLACRAAKLLDRLASSLWDWLAEALENFFFRWYFEVRIIPIKMEELPKNAKVVILTQI